VRARLVARAEDWPWSSVRAHLAGRDDGVVKVAPVLSRIENLTEFLGQPFDEEAAYAALRRSETIGRPLGAENWMLAPGRRGRKPKEGIVEAAEGLFSKLSP
jgi:putative transposase